MGPLGSDMALAGCVLLLAGCVALPSRSSPPVPGGRKKQSVLADSMEALWGAVFVDSDYDTVRSLILRLLGGRIDAVVNGREGYDSKSALQEICQGSGGALPEYRIVKQEGEEHRKVFSAEVYVNGLLRGTGTGRSKKEAQMAAAAQALKTRSHE